MRLWLKHILKVQNKRHFRQSYIALISFSIALIFSCVAYAADLNISVLAVNGTEVQKNKKISFTLPKELTEDDILDTAGLELDYENKIICNNTRSR